MDTFLCGHFRAVAGGSVHCSPVLNFSFKNHHLPISTDVFRFQNLRVKNYSDGDWVSEEDLAKGIRT